MTTHSAIGIKHGNRIKAVYCHWDGMVLYVGLALHTYYQNSTKVNKLISMGSIDQLGAEIGEKHEMGEPKIYLDSGIATQCTFFGRDGGATLDSPSFGSYNNEAEFIDFYREVSCEFFYLYDHGVWYVCDNVWYNKGQGGNFKPLHEVINETVAYHQLED